MCERVKEKVFFFSLSLSVSVCACLCAIVKQPVLVSFLPALICPLNFNSGMEGWQLRLNAAPPPLLLPCAFVMHPAAVAFAYPSPPPIFFLSSLGLVYATSCYRVPSKQTRANKSKHTSKPEEASQTNKKKIQIAASNPTTHANHLHSVASFTRCPCLPCLTSSTRSASPSPLLFSIAFRARFPSQIETTNSQKRHHLLHQGAKPGVLFGTAGQLPVEVGDGLPLGFESHV